MDERHGVGMGVRMVLAAVLSAVMVAGLTIIVGRSLIEGEPVEPARGSALIPISR